MTVDFARFQERPVKLIEKPMLLGNEEPEHKVDCSKTVEATACSR